MKACKAQLLVAGITLVAVGGVWLLRLPLFLLSIFLIQPLSLVSTDSLVRIIAFILSFSLLSITVYNLIFIALQKSLQLPDKLHTYRIISTTIVGVITLIGAAFGIHSANDLFDNREQSPTLVIHGVLESARSQAELHFNNEGQSYSGYCDSEKFKELRESIFAAFETGEVSCSDTTDKYVIEATLPSGDYKCVDYRGNSIRSDTPLIDLDRIECN